MVQNIDSRTDLYQVLGVEKNATQERIEKVYQEKLSRLAKEKTPEAKEKMETIIRAYETLSFPEKRKLYDQFGIEATVVGNLIRPDILHLRIKRIAPITLNELQRTTERFDKGDILNSLILDLRDNIGGSIDFLPYFWDHLSDQINMLMNFFIKANTLLTKLLAVGCLVW